MKAAVMSCHSESNRLAVPFDCSRSRSIYGMCGFNAPGSTLNEIVLELGPIFPQIMQQAGEVGTRLEVRIVRSGIRGEAAGEVGDA
jgi:hypothetical protein